MSYSRNLGVQIAPAKARTAVASNPQTLFPLAVLPVVGVIAVAG